MVMTLTRHDSGESKEMEGLRAHSEAALLTLSSTTTGGTGTGTGTGTAAAAEGAFECKTCSKRFPSFQALGGHRTSHTRLQARTLVGDPAERYDDRPAARVHECAVCGLEFSMGQALGGHMRRHRGEGPPPPAAHDDDGDGPAQPDRDMPDLNLPPLDDDDGSQAGSRQSGGGRGSGPQLLNLLV
ncbi:zinc finger protein ZAT8 [Zea mays]|jgi:hypothetical protein|nr:zinc finger protein ZAT8 [Zea mays]|eukprot:XP_008657926.1 zinc finger protein ZAT8 [Zea mays]